MGCDWLMPRTCMRFCCLSYAGFFLATAAEVCQVRPLMLLSAVMAYAPRVILWGYALPFDFSVVPCTLACTFLPFTINSRCRCIKFLDIDCLLVWFASDQHF